MTNVPLKTNEAVQQRLIFGIGAQKAGTTWLQVQLASMDQVFFTRPKEIHYWDCIRAPYFEQFKLITKRRLRVPEPNDPWRYRLSRFWHPELRERIALERRYASIYASSPYDHSAYKSYIGLGSRNARLVGDITPSYALLGRETFAEMHALASDVRFVFIMRDPIERMWSGLHQQFRRQINAGELTPSDFARRFKETCRTPMDPNFRRSDYMRTIVELEAAVPQSQIHYCFFETLLDQTVGGSVRQELADFLSVPAKSLDPSSKVHTNKNAGSMDQECWSVAAKAMESIYSSIITKFGAKVPSNWGAKCASQRGGSL